MDARIEFQYFYGLESQQFAFYRIPKLLIRDPMFKSLSNDAKLLYGLMLDRMALSIKNEWFDDQDRAYIIYTVDNIAEDLGIGRDKTIKILAELDSKKGIGLIEKIRRGQGKPDIIYVKNFVVREQAKTTEKSTGNTGVSSEVGNVDFRKSEKSNSRSRKNRFQEIEKADLKKSEKPISRSRESRPLEVGKSDANYTEYSYNKSSDTEEIQTEENHGWIDQSIYPSAGQLADLVEDANVYMQMIKENVDYEGHKRRMDYPSWKLFEELYSLICEVVCIRHEYVRIAGEEYPYAFVKQRFMALDGSHLEYVIELMKQTKTKIRNIKAYMLTALFNAPSTIGHYYQQEANYDLYGGGWMGDARFSE